MEATTREYVAVLKKEIKSLAVVIKEHKRSHSRESRRCRHVLIAYGILRGRLYEQIEKPREGNEPDWGLVREIQNARTI
jgi:hypothetical protein